MGGSTLQAVMYVLAGCTIGGVISWLVCAAVSRRRAAQLTHDTTTALADVTRQRDELACEHSRSGSIIKSLKAANAKRRDELHATLKKARLLAKNVLTLRAEREKTKVKVSTIQTAIVAMQRKSAALQSEFDKSRDFYKRELTKSFEKRKALEKEAKAARAEQEAFTQQMEASIDEHGSEENLVAAAQLRLGQLEVLERNVNKLEAENEQLRREALDLKQELESRDRALEELDQLKVHNQQLVSCVENLENSRQGHEADAERFREQADQSEKESETLRLKLEDLQKNFADIEKQQDEALEDAHEAAVIPILRNQG